MRETRWPVLLGTELEGTSHRTEEWRRIIQAVRAVYKGRLTFGANWSGEYEQIEFWDDLDFIGIHAYFPLSDTPSAEVASLRDAWAPWIDRIEAIQRDVQKPVVFTEIGLDHWGRYHDRLVRARDAWWIAHRKVRVDGASPGSRMAPGHIVVG